MTKKDSPSWAKIREAKGLSAEERLFLLTVNGHQNHIMFASRDTAMIWMGFGSKDRFYKTRKSLEAKGLLDINERPGTTTEYRINLDVLGAWPKDERLIKSLPPVSEPVPDSGTPTHTGNQDTTRTGNQDGGRTGNKDHKSNYKSEPVRETYKSNQETPVAVAPVVVTTSSNVKEEAPIGTSLTYKELQGFLNTQRTQGHSNDLKVEAAPTPGHEDCNHGRTQKWIKECEAERAKQEAFKSNGWEW